MNNQHTLYGFIKEANRLKREEKIASAGQVTQIAKNVGGKALKAINPATTVVSAISSAKNTAAQTAQKQKNIDEMMGVSGKFNKVASKKEKEKEDKRYNNLYRGKKKYLTRKQRSLIASGATLGGLALYGGIKQKDPLWAPKYINRNKGNVGAKAVGIAVRHSPLHDVVDYVKAGKKDADYVANAANAANTAGAADPTNNLNAEIQSGGSLGRVVGLGIAAGVGTRMGDALYQRVAETARAKKLEREKKEQEWADAYSKNLKAEDLFKKASIATGDDIVTAVNKSVEKFLPEEIKKREERRNRYNSTVDYVDHGAHGGDAPQRRNK